VSIFGPVTDAERRGWQLQAVDVLRSLLRDAHRKKLPPIDWDLQPSLGVVGRVRAHGEDDRIVAREHFEEWRSFLNAVAQPEYVDRGHVRLWAVKDRYASNVKVTVWCEFYEGEES
jgi:hypothetical protein